MHRAKTSAAQCRFRVQIFQSKTRPERLTRRLHREIVGPWDGKWRVGRRSKESVVGRGRLLRVGRQSVLIRVTFGKQVIVRNGWEARSFWK